MAANRTCYLCGKKYSYCNTCNSDAHKPSWYAMWDSEECKELDDILVRHTMNKLSTEEARKAIKEKKLENVKILNEDNAKHVRDILGYPEVKEVVETKIEESKTEDAQVSSDESKEVPKFLKKKNK